MKPDHDRQLLFRRIGGPHVEVEAVLVGARRGLERRVRVLCAALAEVRGVEDARPGHGLLGLLPAQQANGRLRIRDAEERDGRLVGVAPDLADAEGDEVTAPVDRGGVGERAGVAGVRRRVAARAAGGGSRGEEGEAQTEDARVHARVTLLGCRGTRQREKATPRRADVPHEPAAGPFGPWRVLENQPPGCKERQGRQGQASMPAGRSNPWRLPRPGGLSLSRPRPRPPGGLRRRTRRRPRRR